MTQDFSKQLHIPENITVEEKTATNSYAKFIAEPYESGYGHTVGNSIRRVMLSSLDGAAIVAVRIKGATHEYSTIKGVQEDVINILLNLKKLRLKMTGEGPETLYVSLKGKKEVKASDIRENANIKIVNKDLVIAHLESGTEFEAEFEIARGAGYLTSEEIKAKINLPADFIPMDSLFSPIQKVHYSVENARVGQRTDYDRLVIEVWTDGTITPIKAVNQTAALLKNSLMPFLGGKNKSEETSKVETSEKEIQKTSAGSDMDEQGVEMIELSSRASNCLKVAGIRTIGELIHRTDEDLLAVKNFGKKSLDEIKEKIAEMGLSLGMKSE
ncbi:MAG: DNA-directed RNA polymerase subunit alpha [Elusimicrobiales bacterium]|nr:DNA-directed RNA polymerase subunit alpha [Elusimicrobiales bacterium]